MPTKTSSTPPKKSSAKSSRRYWLVKSEPTEFSIDDLANAKHQTTYWDGVRNYQARNTLRDDMHVGDLVLFYHSNAKPPGIAGLAEVARGGYPDFTAWDKKHPHFDPKTDPENATWMMVDLKFVKKFKAELSLPQLRELPGLAKMVLLQRGSRLSVQPVSAEEFQIISDAAG